MFKILILLRLYHISDAQAEYQIKDRLSFIRFLGITLSEDVLDDKTIWYFREQLVKSNLMESLFKRFLRELEKKNLITREESNVDATFVDVPKQRNTKEENDSLKKGEIPEEWKKESQKKKLAQKDVDDRWTKINDETHYGYKDLVRLTRIASL